MPSGPDGPDPGRGGAGRKVSARPGPARPAKPRPSLVPTALILGLIQVCQKRLHKDPMCWCWPAEVGCGDSTELFKSSPATAVPSKRCFSVAGDVSRSRHASLSASILGDLVFTVKRRLVCPFVICVFSLLWVWNTVLTAPNWPSAHRSTVLAGSKRTVAPVYLIRTTSTSSFLLKI